MEELGRLAGPEVADGHVLLAHLGNGASLAAVHHGRSLDTTMDFSPVGGLVMGTRPGDLDPGVTSYLLQTEKLTAPQLNHLLNYDAGLLGAPETSPDMQDLLAAQATDVLACCGDVPTLEALAAASILREHLPELKIRVENVVDLLKLQRITEHPHGLSDADYDTLFTRDMPMVFAFHCYPWLVHRLTYNRANNQLLHVHGYREEGTVTTAFDMAVLNEPDRLHLVLDVLDRVPSLGNKGAYLKQLIKDKLVEHKCYITHHGEDMPEIREWEWKA